MADYEVGGRHIADRLHSEGGSGAGLTLPRLPGLRMCAGPIRSGRLCRIGWEAEMALVARYLLLTQTQLVSSSGRTYSGTLGSTLDVPYQDSFNINPGTAAQLITFVGATADRPALNDAWGVPIIREMFDTTVNGTIFYKLGSRPASWIDQNGNAA
jgi:hypothetical protein